MKNKILTCILTGLFMLGAFNMQVKAEDNGSENSTDKVEILVVYDENTSKENQQKALEDAGLNQDSVVKTYSDLCTTCIEVDKQDQKQIIEDIEKNPNVQFAQPNCKIQFNKEKNIFNKFDINKEYKNKHCKYSKHKEITINDYYYSLQWGIENTGQEIYQEGIAGIDANVKKAWNITQGNKRVLVGVLDAGIDINHVDLTENIYVNKKEIPDNGIDDDKNGYIDDINGWDFRNKDNSVFDSYEEDYHGTYVASILGSPLNDVGMVGVCPNVTVVPLKFMSSIEGGSTNDAVEAIEYARRLGVKIINCSWCTSKYNPALEEIMRRSRILFVCSSGNNGINIDETPVYPACFDIKNVLTVGTIDNRGDEVTDSNYGKKNVDVLAPGDAILGAFPQDMFYATNGTSASCPFVAGEAALIMSVNPRISPTHLKECIMRAVTKDERYSNVKTKGRIDVYKAVRNSLHR